MLTSEFYLDIAGLIVMRAVMVNNKGIFIDSSRSIHLITLDKQVKCVASVNSGCLTGMVWDKKDTIYICDYEGNRIISYSISLNIITTLVGGHVFNTSCDGPFDSANLDHPFRLSIDNNDCLYVLETDSKGSSKGCIRKINLKSRYVSSINVKYNNETIFATSITISPRNDIYLCDCLNNRIFHFRDINESNQGWPNRNATLLTPNKIEALNDPMDIIHIMDKGIPCLIFACHKAILRLDLITNKLSVLIQSRQSINFLLSDSNSNLYYSDVWGTMNIIRSAWPLKRLLWIGYLKEQETQCIISCLPKEIVIEICNWL